MRPSLCGCRSWGSIVIHDARDIERILVLDDNRRVQEGFIFPIEAAERTAVLVEGPLGTLDEFLAKPTTADAAVSDYQLSPGNYAAFDGAELVSEWYQRGFPALLCTAFEKSNVAQFRARRRWIPVIMSPSELDPDTLVQGLELVQLELQDQFVPARRPWRALIRFVEFDEETNTANAKVPGWSDEVVAFRASDLPQPLRVELSKSFSRGDEFRCFGTANLGSESNEELYVANWETH